MAKLKYKINYPGFSGRNYVLVLYGKERDCSPAIDPTSGFLARLHLTDRIGIEQLLYKWKEQRIRWEGLAEKGELGFELLTDLDRRVLAETGERVDNGPIRVKKRLTEISDDQIPGLVRRAFHSRLGSHNFYDQGYREIFFLDNENRKAWRPYAGSVQLTAHMRPKQGGNVARRSDLVMIEGFLQSDPKRLNNMQCHCEDHSFASGKEGHRQLNLTCENIWATLLLARYHPESVRNLTAVLEREKSKVWLPVHVHEPQHYSKRVHYSASGIQPNFAFFMMDIGLEFAISRTSKYQLSKKAFAVPVMYDIRTLNDIVRKSAGYEVLANKFIFDNSNPIPTPVRKHFNARHSRLVNSGYTCDRLVLEKKSLGGSESEEVIVMDYQKRKIKNSRTNRNG